MGLGVCQQYIYSSYIKPTDMRVRAYTRSKAWELRTEPESEETQVPCLVTPKSLQNKFNKCHAGALRSKPKRRHTHLSTLRKISKQFYHYKIMRFRLKNMRKTLRICCYEEEDLGWQVRFTRKLNPMEDDNDRESDDECIEEEVQRGYNDLLQAFQQYNY